MSVASVLRSGLDGLEFVWAVEGVKYAFASGFRTWSGLSGGWTIVNGVLRRRDLRHRQAVDIRRSDLSASGITFTLLDAEDATGPWTISNLLTGFYAAISTNMAASLAAADTDLEVESMAAFPASGELCVGPETMAYASKDANTAQTLTRGLYGSKALYHLFEEPAIDDARADFGCILEVTDKPISWYGRRCWLFAAEIRPNGTLAAAEQVWAGMLAGDLEETGKLEWSAPAISPWEAQSIELCSSQPTTLVQGILIETDVTVTFDMLDTSIMEVTTYGSFTVDAALYRTPNALYAHITERLNEALAALAEAPEQRYEIWEEDGYVHERLVQPATPPAERWETKLYLRDDRGNPRDQDIVAAALGIGVWSRQGNEWAQEGGYFRLSPITSAGGVPYESHHHIRAPVALVRVRMFDGDGNITHVPVERTAAMTSWYSAGDGWFTRSVVTIDGVPFLLSGVDEVTGTLSVRPFRSASAEDTQSLLIQYADQAPLEVRLGVWFRGDLPEVWRDAFMDNAYVPEALKLGCDSRDFDWTDMESQFSGGMIGRRDRLLTGPVVLRDLLVEDFRYSGMVPILTLEGKISCRPISVQNLVREDGALAPRINPGAIAKGEVPRLKLSPKRIVNKLRVKVTREVGRPLMRANNQPINVEVQISDKASQWRYRFVKSEGFDFSGSATQHPDQIAGHVAGTAASLFNLVARDYPTTNAKCSAILYGTLPMDTALLSHEMLPDLTRARTRGVVDQPSQVVAVETDFTAHKQNFDLVVLTDGAKRSGFAPAALLTAYTDLLAGTEPYRYRLTIDSAELAAFDESVYFLTGFRVLVTQWNVDTITVASEPFALAVDATAGYIWLPSAPTGSMITEINASRARITLNKFDTASQATLAKLYLHVADDADNLLGTSGVLGFRVS